jgi:hypothetical protein
MRLALIFALLAPLLLFAAGCGGDNLALCQGCTTPTPAESLTPTPTITVTP